MGLDLTLSEYSHESCAPCELDEIVTHVKRRRIDANPQDKAGLAKDIFVVPLNNGFFLCSKDLVILTNTLDPILQLDGTRSLGDLVSNSGMESALQQLNYYGLLSFGSNEGQIRMIDIPQQYWEQYKNGKFVTFSMVPLTVELYITNFCNFSCIHCIKGSNPSSGIGDRGELTSEEIMNVISECGKIGVPNLQFMGGEPLAHPDFLKFLQYARDSGIHYLRTSTNAWLIDDSMARDLSKYFDSIQISLHGSSSSTHDYIVGRGGAWEQARRACRFFRENNVVVNLSFTVMRENAYEIRNMPLLAKEWGANSLRFLRLITQGRGCLLKGWNEEEVGELGSMIRQIYSDLGSSLELDAGGFPPLRSVRNDATFYGCDAGKTLMCIESSGGIKACGGLEGGYLGHIRNNSLLDIWHSQQFIDMRRQPDCKDCNYRQICWGPCKVTS